PVASANASGSAVASAFAQPGIVSALRNQPFDALPGDLLTAVTGGGDEGITVELRTQDPDDLRTLLRADTALSAYREVGQTRGDDGVYRVLYSIEAASTVAAPKLFETTAPILRGTDRADAIEKIRARLVAITTQNNVQLALLAPSDGAPDGVTDALQFDVDLSGTQANVIDAIDTIESQAPPMRFVRWRLQPGAGDMSASVRLTGMLQVPWHSQMAKRP
ncbi:MAG: hypothetical protein WA908_05390, partial [Pontixanthobacter sp.]